MRGAWNTTKKQYETTTNFTYNEIFLRQLDPNTIYINLNADDKTSRIHLLQAMPFLLNNTENITYNQFIALFKATAPKFSHNARKRGMCLQGTSTFCRPLSQNFSQSLILLMF